jgi:hypothetical protein
MDPRLAAMTGIYRRFQTAGWATSSAISDAEITVDLTAAGLQRMQLLSQLLTELHASTMTLEECGALVTAVQLESKRQGWPGE